MFTRPFSYILSGPRLKGKKTLMPRQDERPKSLADRREKMARTDRSPIGFLAERVLRVAAIF